MALMGDDTTPMLLDPGLQMAYQAIDNLGRLRMGQQTVNPMQAYQQAIAQRAAMRQRDRAAELQDLQMQKIQRELDTPIAAQTQVVDDVLYERQGGQWVPVTEQAGSEIFEGAGMQAQASNIVFDPNADINSPQYRAAFSALYSPQTRVDEATGRAYTIQPSIPAGVIPPSGWGQQTTGDQVKDPKQFTQSEADNYGYLQSASRAHTELLELENAGVSVSPEIMATWLGGRANPLLNVVSNRALDSNQRRYLELILDSGMVKLRDESGAALSDREIANQLQQLIGLTTDSDDQRKDKQARRLESINKYERATRLNDEEKVALDELRKVWSVEGDTGNIVIDPQKEVELDDPANW